MFQWKGQIGAMSIVKYLFILLFLLTTGIYFSSCSEEIHRERVIVTDHSVCKNRNFIADKPIRVYRFYTDNSFQTALLPYYSEPIKYHEIPEKNELDYEYTIKLYPAFTKYTIGKIYGSCSFAGGCFDRFLLEAEDGLKMWISVMDIDTENCTLRSAFVYDNVATTIDDRNATTYDATLEKDKVIQKPPMFITDYWKDIKYIKNFANEYNKTQQTGGRDIVLEISTGDRYNELYYIHYIRNVLERYFPRDFNGSLDIKFTKSNRPPAFFYGTKSLHPYSCKEALEDPYACFEHLGEWLEKPYDMESFVSDVSEERSVLKRLAKNEKYILINLTWPEIDFDKYKRLAKQIDMIHQLLGKNVAIVIQFNDRMKEGIYVKDNVRTYEYIHLMSQKKFMRVLQKYHYSHAKQINL